MTAPSAADDEVDQALSSRSGWPADDIADDTPLGTGGLELDSFAVLEALLEIEARTGATLLSETLDNGALGTAGGLKRYVSSVME